MGWSKPRKIGAHTITWGDQPQDEVNSFITKVLGKDYHDFLLFEPKGITRERQDAIRTVRRTSGYKSLKVRVNKFYLRDLNRNMTPAEMNHLLAVSVGLHYTTCRV